MAPGAPVLRRQPPGKPSEPPPLQKISRRRSFSSAALRRAAVLSRAYSTGPALGSRKIAASSAVPTARWDWSLPPRACSLNRTCRQHAREQRCSRHHRGLLGRLTFAVGAEHAARQPPAVAGAAGGKGGAAPSLLSGLLLEGSHIGRLPPALNATKGRQGRAQANWGFLSRHCCQQQQSGPSCKHAALHAALKLQRLPGFLQAPPAPCSSAGSPCAVAAQPWCAVHAVARHIFAAGQAFRDLGGRAGRGGRAGVCCVELRQAGREEPSRDWRGRSPTLPRLAESIHLTTS